MASEGKAQNFFSMGAPENRVEPPLVAMTLETMPCNNGVYSYAHICSLCTSVCKTRQDTVLPFRYVSGCSFVSLISLLLFLCLILLGKNDTTCSNSPSPLNWTPGVLRWLEYACQLEWLWLCLCVWDANEGRMRQWDAIRVTDTEIADTEEMKF